MFREQKDGVDLQSSKGLFDVPLGTGIKQFPSDATSLIDVFNNASTLNCENGGTYQPSLDSTRLLRVQFHDGHGWKVVSPDSTIRSIPFATFARNAATATKLGSNTAADFILKSDVPVTDPGEFLRHNGTTWEKMKIRYSDLVNGAGNSPWPTSSCLSGQFLTWVSANDGFSCTSLDLGSGANQIPQLDSSGKIGEALMPTSYSDAKWTASGSHIYRASGNVGIGTTTPSYGLDMTGSVRAKNVSPGFLLPMQAATGQWIRLARVRTTVIYANSFILFSLVGGNTADANSPSALVSWRVKQGGVMGVNPTVNLNLLSSSDSLLAPGDLSSVITTVSSSESIVELWLRVNRAWDGVLYQPLTQSINYGAAVEYANAWTPAFSAALPTGTAATATQASFTTTASGGISYTGNVGIGTSSPGYKLHVVGTAGLSSGTSWTNASDLRLKDIEGDYTRGLAEILKLHTVKYRYKKENPLKLPSDFSKTGFIAQEVEKVLPEAVHRREDGYLELNVDPIHWAAVNAIQELATEVQVLREQDKAKDRELQDLRQQVQEIKERLDNPR
ncbi:hypothetical protein AZI86_08960 [Bdellovibrio bacteriovorus]|uniref:Peptidase S74 domain-containing protein n=1 Tax=Bdellovibrio bacteriovorus TaxID=959 RepID=A0A150WRR3_BDEBC|nr:hypothetical protein AZI86_08960 [Bdellovibrio bacteriovorus]